jgi:hypothetical protein
MIGSVDTHILGSYLRIAQSLTLLLLGTEIDRVPSSNFLHEVVVRALRVFPLLKRFAYTDSN